MSAAADVAKLVDDLRTRLRQVERAAQLTRASVIDDDDNELDVVAGISTANAASLAAADALDAATDAQAKADGQVVTYYTATAPVGDDIGYGDWWLPPSEKVVYTYDGDTWVVAADQSVAAALNAASNAQTTADGKIVTYFQDAAPPTASEGDVWFKTPENVPYRWTSGVWAALVQGVVQSVDYASGDSGWGLSPDATQVGDLNVLGTLGASLIAADAISLAGADLATMIAAMPRGRIAYARRPRSGEVSPVHAGNVTGTTAVGLYELATPGVELGRGYDIAIHGLLQSDTADSAWDLLVYYTVDGTAPTAGVSPILDGTLTRVVIPSSGSTSDTFRVQATFVPSASYDSIRMLLAARRTSTAAAAAWIYATDVNRAFEWSVDDIGAQSDPNLTAGATLAQVLKQDGSAAEPRPTVRYTRSWTATWGRSYTGVGATFPGDPTDLYQGYTSAFLENTRSLIGFNYASIQAALAGATIYSCTLSFKVRSAGQLAGLDLLLGTHQYTTKPSTWSAANVTTGRGAHLNLKPGTPYTRDLPASVAADFASGTARGLAFGPGTTTSSAYIGRLYAAPKLTFVYEK